MLNGSGRSCFVCVGLFCCFLYDFWLLFYDYLCATVCMLHAHLSLLLLFSLHILFLLFVAAAVVTFNFMTICFFFFCIFICLCFALHFDFAYALVIVCFCLYLRDVFSSYFCFIELHSLTFSHCYLSQSRHTAWSQAWDQARQSSRHLKFSLLRCFRDNSS